MDLGIAGRAAVVAASSKGLGRAIARALAAEGCRVVVNGRDADACARAAAEIADATGAEVIAHAADVSTREACEGVIDACVRAFGGVDILVNNSGGPRPGTFKNLDDVAWSSAADVTLLNVVRMIRAAEPYMRRAKWGRIVNVTSISAKEPIAGLLLSNAYRAAVHGMAKTLSRELAPDILVNNVCPGLHRTDRLEHLAEVRAKDWSCSKDEAFARMAGNIPLGRLGDPAELAAAAAFLCSERAGFITGQSVVVDGGASAGLT